MIPILRETRPRGGYLHLSEKDGTADWARGQQPGLTG